MKPDVAFRTAHDLGLAIWCGGYCMGAVALNGASREVDDPLQRGRVANAGWFRWAPVVTITTALHLAGAMGLTRSNGCNPRETPVSRLREAMTVAALLATIESGRQGRRITQHGDVPIAAATQPISDTPAPVAAAQRRLRVLQWVIPLLTAGLIVVDAWQVQREGGTRLFPGRVCRMQRSRG